MKKKTSHDKDVKIVLVGQWVVNNVDATFCGFSFQMTLKSI